MLAQIPIFLEYPFKTTLQLQVQQAIHLLLVFCLFLLFHVGGIEIGSQANHILATNFL